MWVKEKTDTLSLPPPLGTCGLLTLWINVAQSLIPRWLWPAAPSTMWGVRSSNENSAVSLLFTPATLPTF